MAVSVLRGERGFLHLRGRVCDLRRRHGYSCPGTEKVRGKRMQRRSSAPAVAALIKISARLAGGRRQDKEDAAVQNPPRVTQPALKATQPSPPKCEHRFCDLIRWFSLPVLFFWAVADSKTRRRKNGRRHQQTMATAARQLCPDGAAALKHRPGRYQEADGWRMGGWKVARGGQEVEIRDLYIERLTQGGDQIHRFYPPSH